MSTALTVAGGYSFNEQMQLAKELTTTGFLPNSVKTPAQALAIIQTGKELGIGPMHALRSIHIIQGKPTLSAELQLGLFKAKGGQAVWIESTAEKATIKLRHPNGDEHTETFTFEEAKRAGITSKDGWKNYPKAMLRARASSAGLRAVAPDIIAGLYDPEELGADLNERGELVLPPATATVSTTTEPGVTAKQRDLFARALASDLFTDEEKDVYVNSEAGIVSGRDYQSMLDDLIAEGTKRKAADPGVGA